MRLPYVVRAGAAGLIRSVPVRITGGPNRGARWSLASSGRGVRHGTFEAERLEALAALVRPGDHVWDLGAHKGYVTLALADAVGPAGSVTAVEPSRRNLWYLRKHLEWNRASNVTVVRAAVADHEGTGAFGGHGSTIQFHLGEGDETVRVVRLPTLIERGHPRPSLIKMDVEGAEGAALEAAGDALGGDTVVFVSVHSREQYARCRGALSSRGYRLLESRELGALAGTRDAPWREDPELVAFGPARHVDDALIGGLSLFRNG